MVKPELLAHERIVLRCEGLDTIATLKLNGVMLGHADNMFRTWEYDLRPALREGPNRLEIAFRSPMQYVREKAQGQRFMPAWGVGDHKLDGGSWIRKEPCNFGWDWGPMLATCGIWRDIELVAFDTARLHEVHVLQEHATDGSGDAPGAGRRPSASSTRPLTRAGRGLLTRQEPWPAPSSPCPTPSGLAARCAIAAPAALVAQRHGRAAAL